MRRHLTLAPLALSLFLTLASGDAKAAFLANVTATVATQGSSFLYTYTVADLPTSTFNVGEFDLNLTLYPIAGINTAAGAPITTIMMPTGYVNTYTLGDPTIAFQSTSSSFDLTPGTSMMFSFVSTFAPARVADQLATFDGAGPIGGFIIAPATVPEPASLVLSGLGALGLIGRFALGRRRKPIF